MDDSQESMQQQKESSQLTGLNSSYLESLYEAYLNDPQQVEPSWRDYFSALQVDQSRTEPQHSVVRDKFLVLAQQVGRRQVASTSNNSEKLSAVMDLIYAYRSVGHQRAKIDPLNHRVREETPELELAYHGLSEADLNDTFVVKALGGCEPRTLRNIIESLQTLYCGHVGVEYMHITSQQEKQWIRERIEHMHSADAEISPERQKWLLQRLVAANGLEKYLGMKYVGQKRFSLEGGDALIPLLDALIRDSANLGTKELVVGMAHRGRLNVLVNVFGKTPAELFSEFEGKHHQSLLSGDMKYHNGFSSDIQTEGGMLHMALAFNPSHLEIVSPVVEGSVRARQARRDHNVDQVLAIQIHGDAAFAGQGVVMETLNMSQTRGFRTSGSIHIVCNNQIGFTTSHPLDTRSTYYCTDVAKMIEAPVLHVNGDDPESVYQVAQLALAYRNTFCKDIVIDLVCYRAHGHNEADEPSATQPMMYKAIRQHPIPAKIYADQLIAAGVLTAADYKAMEKDYRQALEAGESVIADMIPASLNQKFIVDWGPYQGCPWDIACSTRIERKQFLQVAQAMEQFPVGLALQKQVKRTLDERAQMTAGKTAVNWGHAELLAYATLVDAGFNVRLSGEDVGRGTFAHRHAVLHDQNTGENHIPLQHIHADQGQFEIIDSLLSEEAVMAFEYGYSASDPKTLVIWEAQFGDFANGAQVVIDQFICSGEEKWGRLCGLVLFLPHGQEGMGAEHSSARLERFLQLCAHDNMQVCVPTTPAQHFHMLRRQLLRPFRKPLIVMTPKSLLRHPLVTSSVDDLIDGEFQLVIDEQDNLKPKAITRVVLCQGKVYYDLLAERRKQKVEDVAIIRIEQLYPFPKKAFETIMAAYAHVTDIVWCQEEPENQGTWYTIQFPIRKSLNDTQKLSYVGREAFAAPAVGYPSLYHEQQHELVAQALKLQGK